MAQVYPPAVEALPAAPDSSKAHRAFFKGLTAFIGRRLVFSAAVLLAIIYLVHFTMLAAQGMDLGLALREGAVGSVAYLGRLLRGDFGLTVPGSSAFRPQPVGEVVSVALVRSLGLLGAAFLVAIVIGFPLGVWAAYRRHTKRAIFVLIGSFIGVSTPSFFAALFLQIAAIQYTRTFGQSIVPVGGFGWDRHLILPMLVLAARPVAQIARVTFVSLSSVLTQDYVRTAHGKGMRTEYIFLVHIIRNAAIPILTTIIVSLRFSLGSLPVVEAYFGWNGLGDTLLRGIFIQDTNLVSALLLSLGIVFLGINLVLETSYYLIDPRLLDGANSASRAERGDLRSVLESLVAEIAHFLAHNPISQLLKAWKAHRVRRARRRDSPPAAGGPARVVNQGGAVVNWGAWRRGTLGNIPLLLGGGLVGILIFLVLFGPRLAPHSPNTTQILAVIDGEYATPPFPPSPLHPWGTDPIGRDMLSLVVAGAQQTVIMAFAVVLLRMALGFVLGLLAGWYHETWLDRVIVGATQALAVFPTLLLAALLIFAIGFETGMRAFIVALALIGWGEIVQFVRGEVASIRPKPFIDSAIAVGQRTSRLFLIHIIPNLAPALISLAALELGAVLLILGELGFIGIFLQGGAGTDFGLYAQVPEWGSLLSNIRNWTRSYPWTGFYPAMAFFLAVLGFNLLGEGLRRLIEAVGLVVNRLFNAYTLTFVILLAVSYFWLRTNSGELVFYRQQATEFSGSAAMAHIEALTAAELDGRALGSPGLQGAAEYIRDQFKALGLQPAGEASTYFQTGSRTYLALEGEPVFEMGDGGAAPGYLQDYAVYPGPVRATGRGQGQVRLLVMGDAVTASGLDLAQDVVLLLSETDLPRLAGVQCQGVLVLAPDLLVLKRRLTLSPAPAGVESCGRGTPVLWVSDKMVNRLLQDTGRVLSGLGADIESPNPEDLVLLDTGVPVTIEVQGSVQEDVPVVNVIGQLPGSSAALDSEMILVAAQYDAPPMDNTGLYPGANDNASGVAAMLEAIRALRDSEYQPFRTFLFVAFSGEGLPDLAAAPEIATYLGARTGFDTAFDVQGVIYLRGLAAGSENTLAVWARDNSDLSKLLSTAANLSGMETERADGSPSMNIFVPDSPEMDIAAPYPLVGLSRQGWERSARLAGDSLTFMSPDDLEASGEALSLGLMILGRE